MPYSCYDNESGKFIHAGENSKTKEECIKKAFEFVTEDNDKEEIASWLRKGKNREGALEIMQYFIIKHS